ncbi:MAG: hypothetical protein ACKOE2_10300 [Actinomycetales bacterium]
MTDPAQPPASVVALARQRDEARQAREFQVADELRAQITEAGWRVVDTADGPRFEPLPPFTLIERIADLPDPMTLPQSSTCGIGLVVDGWPEDLSACVSALLRYAPDDVVIHLLDCGNIDEAGLRAEELAAAHPQRIGVVHLASGLDQVGWGAAGTALVMLEQAPCHVVMDLSSRLTGDAITPLLAALDSSSVLQADGERLDLHGAVVAAGWRGVDVNVADQWRSFDPAGPGEVDALLGYFFAIRTDVARRIPPSPKAKFYRNADMEWSLALREVGGRLVAMELPIEQARHHGYHDSDPQFRDREAKRTYDRLLQRFRGRHDLLRPRTTQ